jgi:hypothetical protein
MKIDLYFRCDKKGSVESKGEVLEIIGATEIREIVGYYQRTTNLRGVELLNHMLQHMRGMWWAEASGATLSVDPFQHYDELH